MKRDSRCSTGKSALLTSNELLQVERFKCSHCGIIFTAKLELLEHLREEHGLNTEKAIRNVVNAGHLTSNRVQVQRYQCSHCFIFFPSKLELLDHLGKEHSLNVENALSTARRACPVPSTQSPPVQRFQCSHCVLIFESKLMLLEHLGKDHDLDVDKAIRNATLPPPGEATPSPKPSEEVATERSISALQPEVNGLNRTPDTLSTVMGNKPVANEKSAPNIAKPTSKNKRVSSLAGRVKGSQETSRKITQYFSASSGQNVKSSFYHVTSPDLLQRADTVTPPAKNPRHGMIKIRLPTCAPRKPLLPDGSTVTLELINVEEDHKLPKNDFNDQQHNDNAGISRPKQMEDNPSINSPTPRSHRADLQCDSCTFCHKSVVAMFVHYQSQHPQIVMTLDQIRRTRALVSATKTLLPETSSEDLILDAPNQDESPTDPSEENPSSGSSERTKVQSEPLPEENTSAVDPLDPPDAPQRPLVDATGAPCSVRPPTPILSGQKTQLGASTSPPVLGPPRCAAVDSAAGGSPAISRPRISRNAPPRRPTPPQHEAPVRKESCAGVEAPGSPADGLKDGGHGEAKEAEELVIRRSRGKNLFFCPKCNYGNRGLRLVLVHFKNKHKGFQTTTHTISNYTEAIHRQMKKSKSPNNQITVLSSGLPVPILQGQGFFFCPQCNYGNQLISRVMDHLKKSHPDGKISKRQIFGYTAEVYEQPCEEQLKFEAISRPSEPALGERKITPFLCHRCDYGASNAYLLKRHLGKNHKIHQSAENILRTAFAKGRIEEGFHCQWCNFSDKKAERVFDHYKEKHRSNVSSLKHIINHFHMAPKDAPSKKEKDPASPAMRWRISSGTKKAKTFSCRKCSFKSISLTGLTKHKSRAHPSSVKGKASASEDLGREAEDQNSHATEADGQLDYNLAPKTLEPSPGLSSQSTPSSRVYMCRCCSLLFSTWQGLKIHYGMKHFEEWKSQPSLFEEEAALEGHRTEGNVVFKCPWCVYVHTTRHGVVSHCRARHHTKKVRAEVFEKRLAHVPHGSNGGNPRSRVRAGGYMCHTCNEVCRSLKKFNLHDVKCHGDSGSCVLKPAAKYALTKQLLSKYQGSMKKGFSKKNQAGLLKCPWCKHVEKSKEALAKHVNACSKSMRDVFKCTVCSYITLSNKYLKQHYRTAHGLESKTTAMEYTAVSYNCKLCPYVSSRRRYLLCHYTKSHGMDPPEELKVKKSFECQKCGQVLSSASGLSAHYTGVHLAHFQMDFKVLYRSAKRRAVAGYACQRCGLQVRSTRELRVHLDLHREQRRGGASGRAVAPSSQSNRKGASPKPVTSPAPAPEKAPPRAEAHACALCGRWFPSLMGLRVHERRSHGEEAAVGGAAPGPAALSTDRFDQCTQFRPGSLKAFHCLICAYRTNMLCLLKSHFRKKHPEPPADRSAGPSGSLEVEGDGPPAAGDPPAEGNPPAAHPDLQRDPSPAPLPAVKTSKHSVYSEPAEVQRQLSHYRSMAPANSVAPLSAEVSGDRTLPCEFCDFSSGHWSSVRRHYMNIHGKKVHRCKDCCYFTGLRRKLDLHKKTGHSRGPAQPPPQKRLRCPLCLYHTLSREHLVDHVVLHRQERVVPIELRRPRLSRYLADVVFRCQECTFTCGSAGALGAHALKHGPAGPYACRLCYFRCPRLSLLEAHLWDKHQVERNHELVGQVNLDHLGGRSGAGEEGQDAWSHPREGNQDEEGVTPGWDGVQRQEGRDATARPRRRREEEEEGLRGQEEEEGQRRCDGRPPAAPRGSEDGCTGGVGFTSKRRAEGEASALEDGGAVGPPGGPGADDGPSGAQGSSGASGRPPPAAPPVPDGAADTEPREEPSLSPEVPRDHRAGRGDGLGSPEMPVLENVYLDRRLSWQGSLQRGEPPSGGALGGSGDPGTSPTKAAPADPSAAPRTRSGDPGALSCPYCGRIFCTAAELQGHVKRHRM
ncbi:unnamed protein product [Gadus morhua 'NCC']